LSNSDSQPHEVWVGRVELRPVKSWQDLGLGGPAEGAFATVVCSARNEVTFRAAAGVLVLHEGWKVEAIDEACSAAEWSRRHGLTDELWTLVQAVALDSEPRSTRSWPIF